MLKHIDSLLNADLLSALQSMGHGDLLAIVDANFPAESFSTNTHVNLSGVDSSKALNSILKHFPLDGFTKHPVLIMAEDGSDRPTEAALDFMKIKELSEERQHKETLIGRQEFYQITKQCRLVVSTSDLRPYACLLLQKGVITR